MVITPDVNHKEQEGLHHNVMASIAVTPEMLALLSSKVYSDKISAFIRELSTNAYDAMVEAGTITNSTFKVTLPTLLVPIFSIRDFGTGLSKEAMYSNFKDYGNGTKAQSNAYNGAFGIGSKSPMAYVNDFTIASYYNGVKTTYIYGKNSVGIPVLSEVCDEVTSEHNGLEVTLSIQPEDINKVIEKAKAIYMYFDKKPECNIELDYEDYKAGTSFSLNVLGQDIKVYLSKSVQGCRTVMANVCYKLPNDENSAFYSLRKAGIIIEVPTGSLSITPSRETLEASKETIKFFEDFNRKLREGLGNLVDKTKSVYDQFIQYGDLCDALRGYNLSNITININGVPLSFGCYPVKYFKNGIKEQSPNRYSFSRSVYIRRGYMFLYNDVDGFQDKAIKYCFDKLKADKIYVLNKDNIKELENFIKGVPIIKKSDILKDLQVQKTKRSTPSNTAVLDNLSVLCVSDFKGGSLCNLKDCKSSNGKTYYAVTKSDKWYSTEDLPLTNKVQSELQVILALLVQANPHIDKIAVVNGLQVKSIQKNPDYIEITNYVINNQKDFNKVLDVFTVGFCMTYLSCCSMYSDTRVRILKEYPDSRLANVLKIATTDNSGLLNYSSILQAKFNTIMKVINELGLVMDKPAEYDIIYTKESLRLLQIIQRISYLGNEVTFRNIMDIDKSKCLQYATEDIKVNDLVCLAYR